MSSCRPTSFLVSTTAIDNFKVSCAHHVLKKEKLLLSFNFSIVSVCKEKDDRQNQSQRVFDLLSFSTRCWPIDR